MRNMDYEPHLHLTAQKDAKGNFVYIDGEKQWTCFNCKAKGGDSRLSNPKHPNFIECGEESKPCPTCGEHPICSKTCGGVLSALASVGVIPQESPTESPCGYTECQNCGKQTIDLRYGTCFPCSEYVITNEKLAWAVAYPEHKWAVVNPAKIN